MPGKAGPMTGRTFRSQKYDLAVDTITERDIERLMAWLGKYPRLTMADETQRFEEMWSRWLGVKYSVMCNSGSSANLLMYAALDSTGRSGKRRVIVPATGWATTITPVIQLNWRPFMCETDERTYGPDIECLEKLLKRTRPETVVVVHVLGVPSDMTAILGLQRKYGFQILEDCCASHGARHKGRLVGTLGAMSSFSFYYGHHMSTIEGGMVSTNDETLYLHLLMLRSHGWLRELPPAEAARLMRKYKVDPFHFPFTFAIAGYNLRPTDVGAKIGQFQLSRLSATVARRAANHRRIQKHLEGTFEFARGLPGDVISSNSFCAVARTVEEKKKVVRALARNMIDTRIFTAGNLGRHPFWTSRYGVFSAPTADKLYERGFFLPNNQTLGRKDIDHICRVALDGARTRKSDPR